MPGLIDGKLVNTPVATNSSSGEFQRADSSFHGQIHPALAGPERYHLYVSYACPWAHRTLIVRKLKLLDDIITVSVAEPFMGEKGWSFPETHRPRHLYEVYLTTDAKYTGKITVPVLWDKKLQRIINNESSEIIRIFNEAFNQQTGSDLDLYPEHLREEIDRINDKIYHTVNNGVYKTGFATSQSVYEKECRKVFNTLDELENILGERAFLLGDKITEADIRLFTTLLRFDPVYFGHFKCNLRRISDYRNLFGYLKSLYQIPAFKETSRLEHIKEHYYRSHDFINPTRIVPIGPEINLDSPHYRGKASFHHRNIRH
jgi:glutathionyl-hydroquinone reductase